MSFRFKDKHNDQPEYDKQKKKYAFPSSGVLLGAVGCKRMEMSKSSQVGTINIEKYPTAWRHSAPLPLLGHVQQSVQYYIPRYQEVYPGQ